MQTSQALAAHWHAKAHAMRSDWIRECKALIMQCLGDFNKGRGVLSGCICWDVAFLSGQDQTEVECGEKEMERERGKLQRQRKDKKEGIIGGKNGVK